MKAFLTSIIVQLLLMAYVFYHLWLAVPAEKKWRRTVVCALSVLLTVYLTGFFFHHRLSDGLLHVLLALYDVWYVAVIYIALLLSVIDVVWVAGRWIPFCPRWVKAHRAKVKPILLGGIVAIVAFFLLSGYHAFLYPKVKHQTIRIAKPAGKMRSVRIALATDIHAGYVVTCDHLKRFVDLINAQQCDLILLGGDMIDYDLHILNTQRMDAEFSRLKAPLGVYAILGNHEHRFNTAQKRAWLERCGMTVLQDSVAMPKLAFYLIGRDDKRNRQRKSLDDLMTGLDRTKPLIVADHQPFSTGEALMHNVDLMLSGHTHNGQIWPNNIVTDLLFDGFGEGHETRGGTQFYTSSGLGVSGPPFRVFTDSEIVVFELIFEK
jgi:predicted MPP superfamily phosphohydrolase